MTEGLPWGRHYLMCPPTHFGVLYEINPWMHREVTVDPHLARDQWERLVAVLQEAGARIDRMEPQPDLPDLVFTANAGIVNGRQFIPAHFRSPERQPETSHDVLWFRAREHRIDRLPDDVVHEGAGDALPFGGDDGDPVLLSGYRTRSDARAHVEISRLTGAPVRPIELTDERFYHLDLTFCPVDGRRALCVPAAWDRYGVQVVRSLVPEPLELDLDEGLTFAANSVVIDRTIVMPACPPRVGRQLEQWGLEVVVCDVSEFLKAGGGVRCLTLALDVNLGEPPPPEP